MICSQIPKNDHISPYRVLFSAEVAFQVVRLGREFVRDKDGNPPFITFDCKKYKKKLTLPRAIYADMESILRKMATCQPNPGISYTEKYQKHEILSYAYIMVPSDERIFEPVMRLRTAKKDGEDLAGEFLRQLAEGIKENLNTVNYDKPMDEDTVDYENFHSATECHICGELLGSDRVKDHDHTTGDYRGAAHRKCNLHLSFANFTPVFFHNFSKYDLHLFIQSLHVVPGQIYCIAANGENFITMSKWIKLGTYIKSKG